MEEFKGKNIVITGANRGIGLSCLKQFCLGGASILYAVVRTPSNFMLEKEKIEREFHSKIVLVNADFSDEDSVKSAAKNILSQKTPIDILVNNVGVSYPNSLFPMTSMKQIRESFEINFFSPLLLTRYIAQRMVKEKSGSIIFITSISAYDGGNNIEYTASKAAIIGAIRRLAIEYGKFGIRVNGVAPGFTDTEMGNSQNSELFSIAMQRNIIKRMASPDEIAVAVAFLGSDRSSYITGQVLKVSGGI